MLGVPVVALSSAIESLHARVRHCYTYGTLAPPPMSACVGFIAAVSEMLRGYLPINRLYSGGEVGRSSAGVGGDGFVCASRLASVVCLKLWGNPVENLTVRIAEREDDDDTNHCDNAHWKTTQSLYSARSRCVYYWNLSWMEALMRRIHVERWAGHIQPPRNPRTPCKEAARVAQRNISARSYSVQQQWAQRRAYTASARRMAETEQVEVEEAEPRVTLRTHDNQKARMISDELNAPSHARAARSGKLAALHARLSLPSKLPLQTLARCLIDSSVDSRPGYNNAPLALLGQDLLGYYTSEHLLCHYPRLPMPVLFAAQYAFVGPATLGALRAEWGVEVVASPGQEVDPGLLQLKRVTPGNALSEDGMTLRKDMPSLRRLATGRRNEEYNYRRGMSSRIVYDDQFGDLQTGMPDPDAEPFPGAPISSRRQEHNTDELAKQDAQTVSPADGITVEAASASFVRALTGALHLHAGPSASKTFHAEHMLSRHLQLHQLFAFTHPTRDLSRLCLREKLEAPVARLISETGRHSRSPVFVVGVFSGEDKLGEGAGSSLNEARVRASAAALRSWYLYSPTPDNIVLPSDMELAEVKAKKTWKPQMVDVGEIIT